MENIDTPLAIAVKICSGLSITSVAFTLFVYIKFKETLPVFYNFVATIQISAGLSSLFKFIPNTGGACVAQGFFCSFGSLCAVAWSSILAQKFYLRHVYEEEISKNILIYSCIAFGASTVLAALPLITNSYQDIGGYCWIEGNLKLIWRVFAYYLYIFISIVFTFWRYNQLIKEIKLDIENLPTSSVLISDRNSSFRRMRMYSVILLMCFGPSIIYLIIDFANKGDMYFELICMCFEELFGFLNCAVYVCKKEIIEMVCDIIICKKDEERRARSMSRILVMDDEGKENSILQDFSMI